jgi:hypothetical protein
MENSANSGEFAPGDFLFFKNNTFTRYRTSSKAGCLSLDRHAPARSQGHPLRQSQRRNSRELYSEPLGIAGRPLAF